MGRKRNKKMKYRSASPGLQGWTTETSAEDHPPQATSIIPHEVPWQQWQPEIETESPSEPAISYAEAVKTTTQPPAPITPPSQQKSSGLPPQQPPAPATPPSRQKSSGLPPQQPPAPATPPSRQKSSGLPPQQPPAPATPPSRQKSSGLPPQQPPAPATPPSRQKSSGLPPQQPPAPATPPSRRKSSGLPPQQPPAPATPPSRRKNSGLPPQQPPAIAITPSRQIQKKRGQWWSYWKMPVDHENYKPKFHKLLGLESSEHTKLLDERCEGCYTLVLEEMGRRPSWMMPNGELSHHRYGYLEGLSGDQIAYATQASANFGAVELTSRSHVSIADIRRENFSRTEERLYIGFDEENVKRLEESGFPVGSAQCKGEVACKFRLKYSYFKSLHTSLDLLPNEIILRILPEESEFIKVEPHSIPQQYANNLNLSRCSPDQVQALETIISCPSRGPPVLITGPFGTGKTWLLATAAHYFFQEATEKGQTARVLVCTQQHVSADTFLDIYNNQMVLQENDVWITRLIHEHKRKTFQYKKWQKTIREFESGLKNQPRRKLLVITTCQTSLKMRHILPPGFFTHILIDEAAQMREPEAVAPLCLANRDTKIVMAGDQFQAGPAMLVLGEEPQAYGLAESLLERLLKRYYGGEVAKHYTTMLSTNYRCLKEILTVAKKLFYKNPLTSEVEENMAHQDSKFPLRFICSSVDDKVMSIMDNINESEAKIALEQAVHFTRNWPQTWGQKNLSQICFMSPSRRQLTVAANLMREAGDLPDKLQEMSKFPTYDVQGREFKALFLSTSEPTGPDSMPCNSTKSICDPRVFNTTISRAQSLVVAVGNPFMLLKMEEHMFKKYGEISRCWSEYLRLCLKKGTLTIHSSLQVSESECLLKIKQAVKSQATSRSSSGSFTPASHCQLQGNSLHSTTDKRVTLQPFREVKGGKLTENDELGSGAFGSVVEVEVDGEICAGKMFNERFSKDPKRFWGKFFKEYNILSTLQHDNIVQYYGLCMVDECDFPLLVMECLDTDLSTYLLDPLNQNLPLHRQASILRDVASGLEFLHRNEVIHGDLTARNVLLSLATSYTVKAKIADFGYARLVGGNSDNSETPVYISAPATRVYMPPEAFKKPPKCTTKLDIFSFGNLSLFTIIQQFPIDLLPKELEIGGKIALRSEVDRRKKYMDELREKLGEEHPINKLIQDSLHNKAEKRPAAHELLSQLAQLPEVQGSSISASTETGQESHTQSSEDTPDLC